MPIWSSSLLRAVLNRGRVGGHREGLGRKDRRVRVVLPDRALLVGRERAAARRGRQRRGRRVVVRARGRAAGRRRREHHVAHARCHRHREAALDHRVAARQVRRQEVARVLQLGEQRRVAVALLRVVLLRGVHRAHRPDGRRLVARHAGAEQARHRDRRDDPDDRDDDEQLDQREALLIPNLHHYAPLRISF